MTISDMNLSFSVSCSIEYSYSVLPRLGCLMLQKSMPNKLKGMRGKKESGHVFHFVSSNAKLENGVSPTPNIFK